MTNASDSLEDEYDEFDEFDDDEERGLSGLVVLIMGVVMLGAFFSVVWIAYQQGIKNGGDQQNGNTPYVAADPDPVKIERADTGADGDAGEDREVYDVFDGGDPDPVTVVAEGPEEPIERTTDDPIRDLTEETVGDATDEVMDRIASLEAQDAVNLDPQSAAEVVEDIVVQEAPAVIPEATPEVIAAVPEAPTQIGEPSQVSALSGSYLVQVGAFGSNSEAVTTWKRLQSKLGGFIDGKAPDVQRADLGASGVYHRLRIGPFTTADAAKDFCGGLKERGQDCLVKPNS